MGNQLAPSKDARAAIAQNPSSETSSTGTLTVTEAAFNKTMTTEALNLQDTQGEMGARNGIVRGVSNKDETYATLEMAEGNKGKTSNQTKFTEFLLQSANEVTEEKYQLVETFGDTVAFFFGTRPKIYQYSGTLLNTSDYPWRDQWKTKYEDEFRGTKCIESKKRAYLTYDYVLREGYILGMNIGQISANPNNVDFSFTMFITREINLTSNVDTNSSGGPAEENSLDDSKENYLNETNLLDSIANDEAIDNLAGAGANLSTPMGTLGGGAAGSRDG